MGSNPKSVYNDDLTNREAGSFECEMVKKMKPMRTNPVTGEHEKYCKDRFTKYISKDFSRFL